MKHIFSVSAIVSKIEKNKDEKNLYEKVNQIVKGAATGSQELIEEVASIIKSESDQCIKRLKAARELVSQ